MHHNVIRLPLFYNVNGKRKRYTHKRQYKDEYGNVIPPLSSASAKPPTKPPILLPHSPGTHGAQPPALHVFEEENGEEDHFVDSPPASPRVAAPPRVSPFDGIRDQLEASFKKAFTANVRRQSEVVACERETLEKQSRSPECPQCSSNGPHDSSGAFGATVLVATCHSLHEIQLNPLRCSNPECSFTFMQRPTDLACIPGSANGFTLKRTSDQKPLWFHVSLLSFVDSSMYNAKTTSVYSTIKTLEGQWLQLLRQEEVLNNMDSLQQVAAATGAVAAAGVYELEGVAKPAHLAPKLPVTTDTLNRNLGAALVEYRYLLARCQRVAEEVPAWPLAQHQPCSACIPGSTHVHYDMCFTLRCLGNRYTNLHYIPPDNRRLFVDNSRVQESIGRVDEQQQEEEQEGQQQQQLGDPGGSSSSHAGASSGSRIMAPAKRWKASAPAKEPGPDLPGDCANFQADKLIAKDSKKVRPIKSLCQCCSALLHVQAMACCITAAQARDRSNQCAVLSLICQENHPDVCSCSI